MQRGIKREQIMSACVIANISVGPLCGRQLRRSGNAEPRRFANPQGEAVRITGQFLPIFMAEPELLATLNIAFRNAAVHLMRLLGMPAGLVLRRAERIRTARRRMSFSQEALAAKLGVKRSAVSNWEAVGGANPCGANLERMAGVLEVSYEWLATGRGEMKLPTHWHEVPAAEAELVENPFERRLLKGWRSLPAKPRILFLELVEAYVGRKSR